MFDVGFWELLLIGVVALLVVGPERLPGLARTTGVWVGKARRLVNSVKADLDREMRTEELKKILDKQNEFRDVYDIVEETRQDLKTSEKEVQDAVTGLNAPDSSVEVSLPDEPPKPKSEDPSDSDGDKRSA